MLQPGVEGGAFGAEILTRLRGVGRSLSAEGANSNTSLGQRPRSTEIVFNPSAESAIQGIATVATTDCRSAERMLPLLNPCLTRKNVFASLLPHGLVIRLRIDFASKVTSLKFSRDQKRRRRR